jgi:TetR/AcrR family transcriptional repressor of lmrAB and yxaGH operons
LNEIIRESGAPKGSVYYYFPGGKEQIGAEAILEAGKIISTRLRGLLEEDASPAEAIRRFLLQMAENVESSGFSSSSPLTTATIETSITCEPINQACRQAFDLILSAFEDKFIVAGFAPDISSELALYITTVIEGGILMSRTYHNAQPLRVAAQHLHPYLSSLE